MKIYFADKFIEPHLTWKDDKKGGSKCVLKKREYSILKKPGKKGETVTVFYLFITENDEKKKISMQYSRKNAKKIAEILEAKPENVEKSLKAWVKFDNEQWDQQSKTSFYKHHSYIAFYIYKDKEAKTWTIEFRHPGGPDDPSNWDAPIITGVKTAELAMAAADMIQSI